MWVERVLIVLLVFMGIGAVCEVAALGWPDLPKDEWILGTGLAVHTGTVIAGFALMALFWRSR